jgi:hypothetical protein
VKIGAENKKQVYWMIALLAIAIPLAVYEFSGMFGTSAAAPPVAATGAAKKPGTTQIAGTLDPTLHLEVLEASRKVKYEAGGRNIFRMEALPIPTPAAPVKATPPPIPTPTPVPPPPPIPLKFYGFANKANEPKKVFLEEGTNVFIAKQGDIVDRRYKVVQIVSSGQNNSVLIEDMLTNNRQSIPMTAK